MRLSHQASSDEEGGSSGSATRREFEAARAARVVGFGSAGVISEFVAGTASPRRIHTDVGESADLVGDVGRAAGALAHAPAPDADDPIDAALREVRGGLDFLAPRRPVLALAYRWLCRHWHRQLRWGLDCLLQEHRAGPCSAAAHSPPRRCGSSRWAPAGCLVASRSRGTWCSPPTPTGSPRDRLIRARLLPVRPTATAEHDLADVADPMG